MQRELMLSTDPASGEWMADLVFFSKTGLLDLERQIQFQTKEIEDMVSGNRQISESLASVGALQDDDKDILRPTIRLASCPTGFDDLFLRHIYGEITAAHSKLSNRSHGSKQQRDRGDVGGGSGVGEEEDQACLSREAVDDSFRRRMAMLKASQSTNFASKELGAAVVFSNMLTSPSYAPPTSGQPSSSLPSKNCTRDGRRSCDEPNAGSSGGGSHSGDDAARARLEGPLSSPGLRYHAGGEARDQTSRGALVALVVPAALRARHRQTASPGAGTRGAARGSGTIVGGAAAGWWRQR